MIECPQSFVVATECQKVAEQNGFRRPIGEENGWLHYGSTTAHATIYLAAAGSDGPWYLAVDHSGVVEELDLPTIDISGPGLKRYAFDTLTVLYAKLERVYQLSVSLPDVPLREFQAKVKNLETTEVDRLVRQRVGQDVFRKSLLGYWQSRCPLTGITDEILLRASHIIAWTDCENDADRLDVHNGLLLSALWDAAFDRGLVTFDDDGHPVFSPELSNTARVELTWGNPISLTDRHRERLEWHRKNQFRN